MTVTAFLRRVTDFASVTLSQDVFYTIRDKTRVIAESHSSLARTIDSSIVQHLQKLRTEIKAHIKNVQNDTGKLAAGVAKEREMSTKAIADLARAIGAVTNTPMSVGSKEDPFAVNLAVHRQLQKQVRCGLSTLHAMGLALNGFFRSTGQRGERLAKVHHHHAAKLCSLRGGYRSIDPVRLADFRRVAVEDVHFRPGDLEAHGCHHGSGRP